MQKLFLTLAILLVCFYGYAQTNSGNMMIGGTISNTSSTNWINDTFGNRHAYKTSSLNFSPGFGYFVRNNLAIGANLNWTSGYVQWDDRRTNNSSFGAGPFVRYYKFSANEKFAFHIDAAFTTGGGKSDAGIDRFNNTGFFKLAVSPGFGYFFTSHWALDLSLAGITYETNDPNKDNGDDEESSFRFGVSSLSPHLGFRYHFGK